MKSQERVEQETITVARARELLKTVSDETYRFKRNHCTRLGDSMERGQFDSLLSIPLVVDFSGKLWNGRHRLTAMAERKAGPYEFLVRYVSPERGAAIQRLGDAPSSWSSTDELKALGVSNTSAVSSAITYFYRFCSGNVSSRQAPSTDLMLLIYRTHPGLTEYITLTGPARRRYRISHGMCVASAYLAECAGAEDAEILKFWQLLGLLGSNSAKDVQHAATALTSASPMLAFDTWLKKSIPSREQAVRRSENVVWERLTLTWNYWISGKTSRGIFSANRAVGFPGVSGGKGQLTLIQGSTETRKLLKGRI
jgi:hypothetical protein